MLQQSVIAYATDGDDHQEAVPRRRAAAPRAASRCSPSRSALLLRPDGLGVFAGLAVFQILMLVGAAVPVFRSLRPTSGSVKS